MVNMRLKFPIFLNFYISNISIISNISKFSNNSNISIISLTPSFPRRQVETPAYCFTLSIPHFPECAQLNF